MFKRKKDGGFTLIELMIVIAVIGILAIVLVPKIGTVKTSAKTAGIDTNMRTVQGYIQSRINSWDRAKTPDDDVAQDIASALSSSSEDKLTNPFTSKTNVVDLFNIPGADYIDSAVIINSVDAGEVPVVAGAIVVVPNENPYQVTIYAHDSMGKTMTDKTVTIKP